MRLIHLAVVLPLIYLSNACSLLYEKEVEYEYLEPAVYPVLTAVGLAPIKAQSGSDDNIKILKAMKASRLEAYRELAEQVYGQRLQGQGTVADMVLGQETLKAKVDGVIRGAKVVRAYQVGENYATEMELDMAVVNQLVVTQNQPRRLKQVHYY